MSMPLSPIRIRLCLLAAVGLAGCHSFKLQSAVDAPARPEATASAPTPPNKHSFRLGPCVVASDIDLKPDLPIFQELSKLPEQVYGELKLAPSANLIQIFVFENRP